MKSWLFLLLGIFCRPHLAVTQVSCQGIHEFADRLNRLLSTNVAAIPTLESEIDLYSRCLQDPNPEFLQIYGQILQDLAFTMYQLTEYTKAVEWSARAVTLVKSYPQAWQDQSKEDILLEHCFYLSWNGNQIKVREILLELSRQKSAFIEGLLLWNPAGTSWQKADSLFDIAALTQEAYHPRLSNELSIWRAQNLLYSTSNDDWQKAYQILMGQLQIVRNNKNLIGEIWIRYQLGFWGRTTGNSIVFVEQFKEVLRLNDQISLWSKNHPFRIRIINALAVATEQTGDPYTATLYIDEAIDYHRSRGETLLLARRQLNKAKIMRGQGLVDQAITLYEEIIPVFYDNNRMENAYSSLNNLANVLSDKGDYKRALAVSGQALKLKLEEKGAVHDDVAITYLNIGHIYRRMGKTDEALKMWLKAQNLLQMLDRQQGILVSNLNHSIGTHYLEQKQLLLAQNHFEKALEVVSLPASQMSNSEIDAFDRITSPFEFLSAQLNLARVYSARAHESPQVLHIADSLFRFCVNYLEMVRFGLLNDQAKSNLQEQAVQIYDEAIRFYLKHESKNHLEEIFDLIEKSKSYALKNQVREKTIAERYQIPPETLHTEQQLHLAIDKLQELIIKENVVSDSLKALFYQAHEKLRNFQDQIKRQFPAYYLEKFQNKSDTLVALQQRLGSNEFVFNFHLLNDLLLCVRIGKQSRDLIQIEIDSNFQKNIEILLNLVSNPETSFSAIAEALSGQTLSFMSALLKDIPENSELIIVPHKVLATLPFELLLSSSGPVDTWSKRNFPYLFKRFTVRYAFSAGTIRSESQDLKPMMYLGVAPMCCAESKEGNSKSTLRKVPLLPFSAEEIRMSAGYWHGDAIFSSQATKNRFLAATSDHNILHLATHGIIDHDQPLYHTRLLFFDDEQSVTPDLYLHELYQMDLGARLAVLSACNTGIGPQQVGEGMLSLARAFRYANCPNVVTSLWSVNDQSTAKIMSLFFQFLKEGKGIASALASAKTEFLRTVPIESEYHLHPYFWAGFVAIGDNQILIRPTSHQVFWYSLLTILIIGSILWAVLELKKKQFFPGGSDKLPV